MNNFFRKLQFAFSSYDRLLDDIDTRAVGRITDDDPNLMIGTFARRAEKNPLVGGRTTFKLEEFKEENLANTTDEKLIRVIKNASSDVDKVVTDYQQHVNPSYEFRPENSTSAADRQAKDYIDSIVAEQERIGRPIESIINRQVQNFYFFGASFLEVVLAPDQRTTVDIAETNPLAAEFDEIQHPLRGKTWVLGQTKNGVFEDYSEDPTIQYTTMNTESTGPPFGRPMMLSALFPIIFDLSLQKDIRQVVRTQAYPFVQIVVDREHVLLASGGDVEKARVRAKNALDKAKVAWKKRKFSDAISSGKEIEFIIHSGLSRANLAGLDVLVDNNEKKIFRGLKTYPVLIGSSQSQTEAQTRIQLILWEAAVKSMQQVVRRDWQYRTDVMLQARGLPGKVNLHLGQINTYSATERAEIAIKVQTAVKEFVQAREPLVERGVLPIVKYTEQYEVFTEKLGELLD